MTKQTTFNAKDDAGLFLRFVSQAFVPMLMTLASVYFLASNDIGIGIGLLIGGVITVYIELRLTRIFIKKLVFTSPSVEIEYYVYNHSQTVSILAHELTLKIEKYSPGSGIGHRLSVFRGKNRLFSQYDNTGWDENEFEKLIEWFGSIEK